MGRLIDRWTVAGVLLGIVLALLFIGGASRADVPVVQTITNCSPRVQVVKVSNVTNLPQNFRVRVTVASQYSPLVQYTRHRNVTLESGTSKVFNIHIRNTYRQTAVNVQSDDVTLADISTTVPDCR